jgi:flagellar hook-basal body protein
MSFYTSLTGLNAATAALSVTSNNIANVGTTGFKRSRADFGDIFATSPLQKASSVIGQGVALKQVSQEFSQGNIQFSASSLDIAITGDGFFPLKSPDGLQNIYTRNGTFLLDDSFAVVNNAGQFLEAALVDSNGKADLENLQKLIIPRSTNGDARETTLVELALNLPAEGEVNDLAFDKNAPETYNLTTSVTVFDAGGNEYLATVYYKKTKVASPEDPTNKWQTYVYIGDTKLNELLIQATDDNGEQLFVNKYGEIRSENGEPPIPPQDIARGATKLFNLDDLKNLQPSIPATASGSPLTDGLIAQWKQGLNLPTRMGEVLAESPIDGVTNRSPITFSLNVDESREPVLVDLSYLNEPGASLTETFTGVEIAREMTNAIAKAYGDERYFDFTSLKETDTSTSINVLELSVASADATPGDNDTLVISLSEQRTSASPAFATFQDLSAITVDEAVTAIQSQINERAYSEGLTGAYSLAVSDYLTFLNQVADSSTLAQLDPVALSNPSGSAIANEIDRLTEIDTAAYEIASDEALEERPEKQLVTFSAPAIAVNAGESAEISVGGYPVSLVNPTGSGVTNLTATQVATAAFNALSDGVLGAVPEIQSVTFSEATSPGDIGIEGVTVTLLGTETAEEVAAAVVDALRSSDFSSKKHGLTFSAPLDPPAVGATKSFDVYGVTVTLADTDTTAALVAAKVDAALSAVAVVGGALEGYTVDWDGTSGTVTVEVPYSVGDEANPALVDTDSSGVALAVKTIRDFEERKIVDNGDGSITVTYARDDGNIGSIETRYTDTGATGVTLSDQNDDQNYAAPTIVDNGDGTLSIEYVADSGDVPPLAFSDSDSTGVSVNVATTQHYRVSVSEKQTLSFTAPTADATNGLTITVAGVSVELSTAENTPALVATKVAQTLRNDPFFSQTARKVSDNLDGTITVTYLLDDGDVDPILYDTTGTGTRISVDTTREYLNTDELTDKQFAQSVAESVAPLQMAAKIALDEKLTKAEILAAIRTAAGLQDVGNAYFHGYGTATSPARGSVQGALAAAEAEAARASSTALSVYEAVLASANGPQRAAVEAYSSRTATANSVLESIQEAQATAASESSALLTEVGGQYADGETLVSIQDYIASEAESANSIANTRISRADSFRAINVGYNAVEGSFTFLGQEDDVIRLGSASAGRNELFGLELVPTAVDGTTGTYGSVVLPNGREILSETNQRYGISVTFNDTERVFEISSGATGDKSSVKISDASDLANLLFGFTQTPADEVVPAATGASPVVLTSDVPVRGIESKPAVLTGGAIGINLDNKFVVDARNDTFVVTVDNVTGLIQMPRKEDYNIEEFRDLLERRINSLADSFGRTVNGVRVEVITNPVTNAQSFQFTTGTTGDNSFLKVSGPSVWGLSDLESARGETTEWVEPLQATDSEGFPLYVDRDGNETTDAGDFSEEETRDLWSAVFFDKGELTFDTAGQLVSPLSAIKFASETIGTSGATLGIAIDYDGSTQFSNPFSVLAQDQNGRPEGDLIGLDIGDDGLVSANYSNGTVKNLAKIVLANFANPTGLRQIGDASYYATSQSGSVTLGEAGTAGFGTVRAGARERANVDLTAELIELITNQRNFQANAKAIETNNTLTQAIINIRS